MNLTKETITNALTSVMDPTGTGDIVASKALQWITVCDDHIALKLHLAEQQSEKTMNTLAKTIASVISSLAPPASLRIQFVDHAGTVIHAAGTNPTPQQQADQPQGHQPIAGLNAPPTTGSLPGVQNIIAVGAGKGGVGKSTVAVNLAVGLARQGHAVGLLDGDIYGPSLPTMLNLHALETNVVAGMLQPFAIQGIKAMTLGKLVEPDKPLIWRGPMAHGAFKQLAEQTSWGELDYLIIDLPPGTGDVPLTLAQMLSLTGAIIVCTPQQVAQDDAVRAVKMFQQLSIDVLGIIENMSFFIGDDNKEYDIFGKGGAELMAQRLGLPFLGSIPITMSLRQNCDDGNPSANFDEQSTLTDHLQTIITNTQSQIALTTMRSGKTKPTLNIS